MPVPAVARVDWISLAALLMSAAAAACLCSEEAFTAAARSASAWLSASSACWYRACGDCKTLSRLAPTAAPTNRVTMAATRSRALLRRRTARIA